VTLLPGCGDDHGEKEENSDSAAAVEEKGRLDGGAREANAQLDEEKL
jgi:hypothetical protein